MKLVLGFFLFLACMSGLAIADDQSWKIWHQPAATDIMKRIESFDILTLWIIIPIAIFVTVLLLIVAIWFNAKANPNPSKVTHNVPLEIIWTVIPVIILIIIAVPSYDLLNRQFNPPEEPEMTVKAIGYQWYWAYEYQDQEDEFLFDSRMLQGKSERIAIGKTDLKKYPRLLAVDNELVVPVDTTVRVLVTSEDVIHSFTVPSFGIKIDAIPLRINETWFKVEREGLYYGQCSELCGRDHAFMPIAVRVVSKEQFADWKSTAENDLDMANQNLMKKISAEKQEI